MINRSPFRNQSSPENFVIPHHKPIETDKNDKLVPYVNISRDCENDQIDDLMPGEYKIVETIYDNEDDDQLDYKKNLDVELISLDKNIMDLYDMHKS